MSDIIVCRWLDSNCRPLASEATTLPTEPQPLPNITSVLQLFKSLLMEKGFLLTNVHLTTAAYRSSEKNGRMTWRINRRMNVKSKVWLGRPPLLRGFVCTYHPKALGSNPEHTIFALLKLEWEKDENKQKEAWIGPYLKSVKFEWSEDDEYSKI